MKELRRAIGAFSTELGQLQSLPGRTQDLQRQIAAPANVGPIEFARTLKELRWQAAAAATEAQALVQSCAETAPLQELLDRFEGVYKQQRAAIAALEAHLRSYGYSATCLCSAPAEPLAELRHANDIHSHNGAEDAAAPAADSSADGTGAAAAASGATDGAALPDAAAAKSERDAAHLVAPASPPAVDVKQAAAAVGGAAGAGAGTLAAAPALAAPLTAVTNLPPASATRQAVAKPAASPSGESTSSGTPFSVSPSLRKLQQKYAVRPAAPDSPDVLPMPPRLAAGTPGQSQFAADAQQRQPAQGGIGRWQAPQQQQLDPGAAFAAPSTANSQQRPCRTVRFAGVRSMSRSPAEEATALIVQQGGLPGMQQPELGRRASVYGYAGVSTGTTKAAAGEQHEDPGRRVSMYAAVDTAAVGPPARWATSAEMRSAAMPIGAAPDAGFGPVTPVPPPPPAAAAGASKHAAVMQCAGHDSNEGVAGALLTQQQAQQQQEARLRQQAPGGEESTMELYSQLIRCRRSPEPQPATPDAKPGPAAAPCSDFCYTPITRNAPAAISPDTAALLARAHEPTSVSKAARPTTLAAQPGSRAAPPPQRPLLLQQPVQQQGRPTVAAAMSDHLDETDEDISIRLPAVSAAFARAGTVAANSRQVLPAVAQPASHAAPQPPHPAAVAGKRQDAAVAAASPSEGGAPAAQHDQRPSQKLAVVKAPAKRTSPPAPAASARAAAVMAKFASQKAAQGVSSTAVVQPSSGGDDDSNSSGSKSITAEEYAGLPPYIRSQIGLAALDAALKTAAAAGGAGFTADTLQGGAGSVKAARAALNCLMKLGRARCEVRDGQMVWHLRG